MNLFEAKGLVARSEGPPPLKEQEQERAAPPLSHGTHQFSVWAPGAVRVDLVAQGQQTAMVPTGAGWWAGERTGCSPGTEYSFRVDGGLARPDPRSQCQPRGVHGPSSLVDHSTFAWTDTGWRAPPLGSGVLYELHIGTFTPQGTFDAAIERLDHLVELGVTHVQLMPICEFPGHRGWGYDGVSIFAPNLCYGGVDGLKRLVDACHARHLAVLADVVYNHFGPVGNYITCYGPYFNTKHKVAWGDGVNLDGPYSDQVRRFFCDNALMWLRDYHFDGLRLDAAHALIDTSAVHFLEQLGQEVEAEAAHLGRHLVLIAESDLNDPRLVRSREVGGYGLSAQWSDDFHHALHTVLTGEQDGYYQDFGDIEHLAHVLEHVFYYDGRHSGYRQRRHGRPIAGLSGHRFLDLGRRWRPRPRTWGATWCSSPRAT